MAARNGHELGCFVLPVNANRFYKNTTWIGSKCIYCGMEVNISEEFKPHHACGININNAPMEIIAMKTIAIENEKAAAEGTRLPFPKRSRGVVFGAALQKPCLERKNAGAVDRRSKTT